MQSFELISYECKDHTACRHMLALRFLLLDRLCLARDDPSARAGDGADNAAQRGFDRRHEDAAL